MAVSVDHHDIARRHGGVPDDLVRRGRAVGDENRWSQLKMRAALVPEADRASMVEQLAQFLDGAADVGAQHVPAEELVEHLAHRGFEEGAPERHSARE